MSCFVGVVALVINGARLRELSRRKAKVITHNVGVIVKQHSVIDLSLSHVEEDQKKTRPEGRVPSGKQSSHSNEVVRERRHSHRVSRASASAEKNMPVNMAAEINDMARLWRAGMGPNGTARRRRKNLRSR